MNLRRPSPSAAIATLALFFALGGTAIAARHYLVTSTSQIKPSVLSALHRRGWSSWPDRRGWPGWRGGPGRPAGTRWADGSQQPDDRRGRIKERAKGNRRHLGGDLPTRRPCR